LFGFNHIFSIHPFLIMMIHTKFPPYQVMKLKRAEPSKRAEERKKSKIKKGTRENEGGSEKRTREKLRCMDWFLLRPGRNKFCRIIIKRLIGRFQHVSFLLFARVSGFVINYAFITSRVICPKKNRRLNGVVTWLKKNATSTLTDGN
jgi:hypothetical protein